LQFRPIHRKFRTSKRRVDHLIERGSTDDLFVRFAVLRGIEHGTVGDEGCIWPSHPSQDSFLRKAAG